MAHKMMPAFKTLPVGILVRFSVGNLFRVVAGRIVRR